MKKLLPSSMVGAISLYEAVLIGELHHLLILHLL